MNKVTLFLIVILSIDAFAQSNNTDFYFQDQNSNSSNYQLVKISNRDYRPSNTQSEMFTSQVANHRMTQPSSLIQLYDSIYNWAIKPEFHPIWKIIDTVYDDNNNLIVKVIHHWDIHSWENYCKYIYTYDTSNNMISRLEQSWDGEAWINKFMDFYTYDANGNLTSQLRQMSSYGLPWLNYYLISITYDVANNPIHWLFQVFDGIVWLDWNQHFYTYNIDNNITSFHSQIYYNSQEWENDSLITYNYDDNNYLINCVLQKWEWNSWTGKEKLFFTRDDNNYLISKLQQLPTGWGFWEDATLETYTYDANYNLSVLLKFNWLDDNWSLAEQTIYTYDIDNLLINESYKYFYQGQVYTSDSTLYYFHTVLGINDFMVQTGNIIAYPNPSSGKFTIVSKSKISSMEIYNLLGELIHSDFTFNQQTSTELDLTNEPNGIYFVKMYIGAKTYTRKIIVQ